MNRRIVPLVSRGLWGNGSPFIPWSWVICWEAPPRRTGCPLGNPLPHGEQPRGPSAQSTPPEPHGLQSPWDWQRWPSPEKYGRSPGTFHGCNWHGASENMPTLYFVQDWSPSWRPPDSPPWGVLQGTFSLSGFSGDAVLERCLDRPLPLHLLLKLLLLGQTNYHLVLVGFASVLETVGGEAVNGSSPPTVAGCGVVASMAASDILPVRSSRGYISTPWALRGQGCKAVLQALTNAWWPCPSSASASHSSLSTLSLWDCSRLYTWVMWWISASLITTSWWVSASLIMASASLMVATHWIPTSLTASVAWFSFWHLAMSVFQATFLWQEFKIALVLSSYSRASFITPCSQSTSSGRPVGLALGENWDCVLGRCWPHLEFLMLQVGRVSDWPRWCLGHVPA